MSTTITQQPLITAEGDTIAHSIVDRQADEAAVMATTVIRRLRMTKLDVDVVLGGGVFRNNEPSFHNGLRGRILAAAPSARILRLEAPPIAGAALLGLDALGATRASMTRLRGALTYERLAGGARATSSPS